VLDDALVRSCLFHRAAPFFFAPSTFPILLSLCLVLLQLRRQSEAGAMPWRRRVGIRVKTSIQNNDHHPAERNSIKKNGTIASTSSAIDPTNRHQQETAQYRISAAPSAPSNWLLKLLTCNGLLWTTRRINKFNTGTNPNHRLAQSLHWMFRVNFTFLFMAMCLTFFALVILFSAFITIAGRMDPQCVRIGGKEFASSGAPFADAFALSWTTFSTVGYGSTYPALGHENDNPTNCFFINFICSLESLIGVLYSGFCGAILFGKVLRIQSHAQVIFSDPLLIRYGSGVSRTPGPGDHSSDEEAHRRTPCPVLEFRIVNRLFNEAGGEIMDASLNVVANINADDADPTTVHTSEGGSVGLVKSGQCGRSDIEEYTTARQKGKSSFLSNMSISFHRDHQTVEEDPSNRLVQHKHVFSKLMIEAPEHPFFKRSWSATHILDEHSPIVKPRVRRLIRKNGGYWPEKFHNHKSIRESLHFNQILVSMNGVSNISASDVYAQKI
jgi:hypothetical protein